MAAASSHLRLQVERRALHILGPDVLLQSLAARKLAPSSTLCVHRCVWHSHRDLRHWSPHGFLHQLVLELGPTTRCATSLSYRTSSRFPLLITCGSCFPYSIIEKWENLPPTVLQSTPRLTSLQSFKGKVHQHLRQSRWYWATDSL